MDKRGGGTRPASTIYVSRLGVGIGRVGVS